MNKLKRKTKGNVRYLFIDTETTGLSPLKNEVIEIGILVTSANTKNIIDELEIKIWPFLERVSKTSAKINGFWDRIDEWVREGLNQKQALDRLLEFWKTHCRSYKYYMVCHDATFDMGFLQALFIKNNIDFRKFKARRVFDTVSMARAHKFKILSGDKLLQYAGFDKEEKPHKALNGAYKTFRIYNWIMDFSLSNEKNIE